MGAPNCITIEEVKVLQMPGAYYIAEGPLAGQPAREGLDVFNERTDAVNRANDIRCEMIQRLSEQIERLKNLDFEVE
jgi:hypothetical protein